MSVDVKTLFFDIIFSISICFFQYFSLFFIQ
nr:MAG TPA: hypothetical protein [Caudoviricetes sp.]